jgi:UDP-3-O-[3-hydroxymyristoyl] glucosamine N-acyltransferase
MADGSKINAQSGVSKCIKSPMTAVTGSPAFDYSHALRSQILNRNLPELEKRIKELEQIVERIINEKVTE